MKIVTFLLRRLRPRLIATSAVISGKRIPLGYIAVPNGSLATAYTIAFPAIPAGLVVGFGVIQCQNGVVRWRDDGTAPDAATGMTISAGTELDYAGDLTKIQFIQSSGTPTLDIVLYA